MKTKLAWCLLASLVLASCASPRFGERGLTSLTVEEFSARCDALSRSGNLEEYATLLANDIVVRFVDTQEEDAPAQVWTKPEYLAVLAESFGDLPVAENRTTIESIEIAEGGQQATVRSIGHQTSIVDDDGDITRMVVQETWTVALRNGVLILTELHGRLIEETFEHQPGHVRK